MKNSVAICTIVIAVAISCCGGRTSSHRRTQTRKKTDYNDRPTISNLTCHDRNFQRTLTWSQHNINENLRLIHYSVLFCATVECCDPKYSVCCYDERNNGVDVVNTTHCKTSVNQLTTFSYDTFFVRGVYRDLSTNKTIRTKNDVQNCRPIEDATRLSPPAMLTSVEKYAIEMKLSLPDDLKRTFNEMQKLSTTLDLSISYFFCVAENEAECTESGRARKSLNSELRYPSPLEANTQYVVMGWYTILGDYLVTSEKSKRSVRTLRDPFPPSAQIIVICSSAIFIIIGIVAAIGGKYIHSESMEAKAQIRRPLTKFLEDAIEEVRRSEDSRFVLIAYRTSVTAFSEDDKFRIPPIQRLAMAETKSVEENFIWTTAEDRHDVPTQQDHTAGVGVSSCPATIGVSQDLSSQNRNCRIRIDKIETDLRNNEGRQFGQCKSHVLEQIAPLDDVKSRPGRFSALNPAYCDKY